MENEEIGYKSRVRLACGDGVYPGGNDLLW